MVYYALHFRAFFAYEDGEMKKRFSFICIYLCLLSLLCLGAAELAFTDRGERISETENRVLQPFPALTAESLVSARFMGEFEDFLSDAFFFRGAAAGFHDKIMSLLSVPAQGPDTGEVDEERLWEGSEESEAAFQQLLESSVPAEPDAEGAPAAAPTTDARRAEDATLWLVNGKGGRETVFTYTGADLLAFADVLDLYRAELPEDGAVFFCNPQVSAVAENVISGRYTDWGSDLEDALQPLVGEGVYILDCADILSPYLHSVNLYPNPSTDYHWHPVSASLTTDAMMALQGVAPAQYDQYRYYLAYRTDGAVYTVKTLANMRYGRDVIEIMTGNSPVNSYMLDHLTNRTRAVFTMQEGGYVGLLGGHKGPWRLLESGFHTGRNALVVGDCFVTPFIPYLMPYYDTLIAVDVRDNFYSVEKADANISDYIRAYDVDDIYVMYSTNSRFDSQGLRSRLRQYLHMSYD